MQRFFGVQFLDTGSTDLHKNWYTSASRCLLCAKKFWRQSNNLEIMEIMDYPDKEIMDSPEVEIRPSKGGENCETTNFDHETYIYGYPLFLGC